MAKIIAIANNKGGVGKTTAAISLAALCADWNLRVALVDNDPQGNVGVYLGMKIVDAQHNLACMYNGQSLKRIGQMTQFDKSAGGLLKVGLRQEKMTVFLSDHRLSFVAEDFHRIGKLAEGLEEIKNDFDLIIIDNGPYIGYLTRAALFAADMVLIPTEAGAGGLAGIPQIIHEAESISTRRWRPVIIRVFVNNFQHTVEFDVNNLHKLKALVGSRLYNTYVPSNIHLRKTKEIGLPIHLLDKAAKSPIQGAVAYRILAKNILQDLFPEFFGKKSLKDVSGQIRRIAAQYRPGANEPKHPLSPNPARAAAAAVISQPAPRPAPVLAQVAPMPPQPAPRRTEQSSMAVNRYMPMDYRQSRESHGQGINEPGQVTQTTSNNSYCSRPIGGGGEGSY